MDGWVPAACTLPTEQQPLRLAEFHELFRSALRRVERRGDTWLRLGLVDAGNTLERARELTERESDCCSFLGSFIICSMALSACSPYCMMKSISWSKLKSLSGVGKGSPSYSP